MKLIDNPKGNYRFLTGIAPYSSGVVAMPGYEIVYTVLQQPLPYRQGFDLIDRQLADLKRPRQALCAIALRSPHPFTFAGFASFNAGYLQLLAEWEIPVDGENPIARTNVAPEVAPPADPSLYAFAYTLPDTSQGNVPTFIVAGAGELGEGGLKSTAIVRPGETSPEAMSVKAAHVMGIMEARLHGLEVDWPAVTAVDIYTVHPLQSYLAPEILGRMGPTAIHGVHWFYSRPPIVGLEFEMDMRGVRQEIRV
jgi:hypothetical protein